MKQIWHLTQLWAERAVSASIDIAAQSKKKHGKSWSCKAKCLIHNVTGAILQMDFSCHEQPELQKLALSPSISTTDAVVLNAYRSIHADNGLNVARIYIIRELIDRYYGEVNRTHSRAGFVVLNWLFFQWSGVSCGSRNTAGIEGAEQVDALLWSCTNTELARRLHIHINSLHLSALLLPDVTSLVRSHFAPGEFAVFDCYSERSKS